MVLLINVMRFAFSASNGLPKLKNHFILWFLNKYSAILILFYVPAKL